MTQGHVDTSFQTFIMLCLTNKATYHYLAMWVGSIDTRTCHLYCVAPLNKVVLFIIICACRLIIWKFAWSYAFGLLT